ncbi:alcohol dehydrogenase [Flagelloscypha sp. PMI_526]|nr:alcohol dehydrogenase [Flagelloscypha sp. PMI_526]
MDTHKALRWHPPKYNLHFEEVLLPRILHPDDAIVKIELSGLCGDDLHVYRGTEGTDFAVHTCGHEFVGEVVELGTGFSQTQVDDRPTLYSTLKIGDKVVSPFTSSCGDCTPCRLGFTCRCIHGLCFGTPLLDGSQAQFVRVPLAGGTLFSLSDPTSWPTGKIDSKVPNSALILLADNLPAGLFAALQAFQHPKIQSIVSGLSWPDHFASPESSVESRMATVTRIEDRALTFGIVGLGPVGICAMISLLEILHRRRSVTIPAFKVVGFDPEVGRRQRARKVYNMIYPSGSEASFIVSPTEEANAIFGQCNAVLEVAGGPEALRLAYGLVKPFGVISSIGVHGPKQTFPLTAAELFDKNVSFDFGRSPPKSMMRLAFGLLLKRLDIFGTVGEETSLVERIVPLKDAVQAYKSFNDRSVGKTMFTPW